MNINVPIAIIGLVILFSACTSDQLAVSETDQSLENQLKRTSHTNSLDYYLLPESTDLAAIPNQDPSNPLTTEKVELGKLLFFETALALDPMMPLNKGTYSCATCHVPSRGFTPGRVQGIADGGVGFGENGESRTATQLYQENELDVQGARPLSLLNVAYVTNTSWSGRFGAGGVNVGTEEIWETDETSEVNKLGFMGLESQNIEGLHLHRMVINKEVLDKTGYTELFDEAFEDVAAEERYSPQYASFAISAYLRTLLPSKAPFQEYIKGNKTALTEQEKRGALAFFGDAGCVNCHNGPGLNATAFYALGVNDLYETGVAFNTSIDDERNLGRGGFTKRPIDMYKFKVPQLYNLRDANFYFHGSSKRSLREVVDYFNNGIPENENVPDAQIAPLFKPLELSERELEDLTAFLSDGLYDPDLDRFVPESVLSGNCIPNNDPISRVDLGCD